MPTERRADVSFIFGFGLDGDDGAKTKEGRMARLGL